MKKKKEQSGIVDGLTKEILEKRAAYGCFGGGVAQLQNMSNEI